MSLQELNDKYCNKFILLDNDADGGWLLWFDKIFYKDDKLVINGIEIEFISSTAEGYGGVEINKIEEQYFDSFEPIFESIGYEYKIISLEEAKTFTKEWLYTDFNVQDEYYESNMPNLMEGII